MRLDDVDGRAWGVRKNARPSTGYAGMTGWRRELHALRFQGGSRKASLLLCAGSMARGLTSALRSLPQQLDSRFRGMTSLSVFHVFHSVKRNSC